MVPKIAAAGIFIGCLLPHIHAMDHGASNSSNSSSGTGISSSETSATSSAESAAPKKHIPEPSLCFSRQRFTRIEPEDFQTLLQTRYHISSDGRTDTYFERPTNVTFGKKNYRISAATFLERFKSKGIFYDLHQVHKKKYVLIKYLSFYHRGELGEKKGYEIQYCAQ